ncbi:glycosyltransferase family 9 protein [Chitinophagaceae bacterium LWZ2-11]
MKVLIIRFSSIGDIVLTTPAIRCVKLQLNAEVHFLTKQSFKAVTEHNPYIDKFFYYKDNLKELIEQLKEERYDYVIDLHKNFRTMRIRMALKKAEVLSYNKESLQKFLLTKLGINTMSGRHITKRCLDAVAPLGVKDDGKGLDYFIAEKDIVKENDLPTSHLHGFIGIVIGASYFTKKLPVDKLQELCTQINHPIILIGGKEDAAEGDEIASIDPIKIYNACGKFNLNESADLVRKSKLIISHDTGMQYIACAFNKQVLAIWGGTSPKLDVEPYYGEAFTNLQKKSPYINYIVPNLSCQPCSNFGTKTCPKGHFKCMKLQNINAMAVEALERL